MTTTTHDEPRFEHGEPGPAVSAVSAVDITRRYGRDDSAVDALRGVSLEIEEARMTAVMGPSGSGKSTLMHVLAGLDQPTEGTVAIAGLETVGIADRRSHRPAELSGGQQQRVSIARALLPRPTVLFADEPTGNLDSNTSRDVLGLLRNSVDELGQTIVMVTHDPQAAAQADRILFLADGRIVKEIPGSTAAVVLEAMQEVSGR